MPSVPVRLGSLGLDFFREVHQQARLNIVIARRLAADALSYRAGTRGNLNPFAHHLCFMSARAF
jgi:hypothetical protein